MSCYSALKRGLDETRLPYNEIDSSVIEVFEKKENIGSIRIVIGFNNIDDNRPWFRCYELGKFPKEKTAAALIACNNANKKYRWIRFYLDEENEVIAEADAVVSEASVFDETVALIICMSKNVDSVYPSFMQARWA